MATIEKKPANVFLCHSSKDKLFVRKLDAALSGAGLDVFLDERGIGIGDSIPDRIYKGLEAATHVVYVISSDSIRSRWVNEELDVAKTRQINDVCCKILPVLIDDVDLPVKIRHLRYADFRSWNDATAFVRACNQLLSAFGVELTGTHLEEVNFIVAHMDLISQLEAALHEYGGLVDGATYADNYSCSAGGLEFGFGAAPAIRGPLECDFGMGPRSLLKKLEHEIRAQSLQGNTRLSAVVSNAREFFNLTAGTTCSPYSDRDRCDRLKDVTLRLAHMITALRLEASAVAMAGFRMASERWCSKEDGSEATPDNTSRRRRQRRRA